MDVLHVFRITKQYKVPRIFGSRNLQFKFSSYGSVACKFRIGYDLSIEDDFRFHFLPWTIPDLAFQTMLPCGFRNPPLYFLSMAIRIIQPFPQVTVSGVFLSASMMFCQLVDMYERCAAFTTGCPPYINSILPKKTVIGCFHIQ